MNLLHRSLLLLTVFRLSLLVCVAQAPDWSTPAERSGYRTTPDHEETMAYVRRVAAAAPRQVRLEPFGTSGEGRTLWTVIVSGDGVFAPAAIRRAGRPVVLIQNGIHAGEIDGKDASLALLRELVITKTQAALLRKAVIVILPVYNVDGHERVSRYHRINQNGPEEMGWRTNAANLNLNRDYIKADAPETRAFLKLWNRWLPDFFFDNHVTDGADYQYDITYGVDHGPDVDPGIARWVEESLMPELERRVNASGHKIGPFINLAEESDPAKGMTTGQSPPRFSTGYTVLQNRPGMLVEMHMLKDYKTRVTGNYELLRAALEIINRDAERLVGLNRAADAATVEAGRHGGRVALTLDPTGETEPFEYLGVKYRIRESEVSGDRWIEYTGEPVTMTIPRQTRLKVTRSVTLPVAYIVPAPWTRVIEVLAAHGLKMQRATKAFTAEVDVYRCGTPAWQARPFEGRHPASLSGRAMGDAGFPPAGEARSGCEPATRRVRYPAGSVVVAMDQRAAKVAAHFLEPEGPDSALAWGFFDAIFERKEYGEAYVLEKLAREMMAGDAKLKEEFAARVATDKEFAASPAARLDFFYRRSPYWDERIGVYPVGRLRPRDGVPSR
jgi:murein tripeptide amidase MpaA